MADCDTVVGAYRALRDGLTSLADQASDRMRAITLRQRALVSGELAEQCAGKFSGGDVPSGDQVLAAATDATRKAGSAAGDDNVALDAAASASAQANTMLNGIVKSASCVTIFADRFRGSLRVSAPSVPPQGFGPMSDDANASASRKTAVDQPAYVASVAMLFPIEAATLFPLGQSIAGNDGNALIVVIALTVAFIVALRYFATQEEGGGSPAVKEILVAVVSFFLWVGALKGYWIAGGEIHSLVGADLGSKLAGFATIMWVAIVPYFVRKPAPASLVNP